MKNLLKGILAGALLVSLTQLSSQAQTLAVQGGYTVYGNDGSFNGTVGYAFTLSSAETLDSLSAYYTDASQATNPQEVGLFLSNSNSTGTLLANATVVFTGSTGVFDTSGPITYDNGFDGTLNAGTTYAILTSVNDVSPNTAQTHYATGGTSTVITGSAVTITSGRYNDATPDTFQYAAGGGSPVYVGPNFTYGATVPEPSTWALMLGGLAALVVGLRLRKRSL